MIANLPELDGLETAEAFLEHFAVPFDRDRVMPLRVPLLRRFRRYIASTEEPGGGGDEAERARIRSCLVRAYEDVVEGAGAATAATVSVASQGERTFIPLAALAPRADSR